MMEEGDSSLADLPDPVLYPLDCSENDDDYDSFSGNKRTGIPKVPLVLMVDEIEKFQKDKSVADFQARCVAHPWACQRWLVF